MRALRQTSAGRQRQEPMCLSTDKATQRPKGRPAQRHQDVHPACWKVNWHVLKAAERWKDGWNKGSVVRLDRGRGRDNMIKPQVCCFKSQPLFCLQSPQIWMFKITSRPLTVNVLCSGVSFFYLLKFTAMPRVSKSYHMPLHNIPFPYCSSDIFLLQLFLVLTPVDCYTLIVLYLPLLNHFTNNLQE